MPRSLPGLWLIALFTAVCPALGQVEERAVRVDTGDILEVMVPRYPELSKPYPVSPTGGITLDLVGEVAVRGLTAPEIEALLERRLAEYLRYPQGVVV
ncbi:MAG: polysaccharide biosynthesis/export family protein, partial [Armatimonadetes bacterium]|nr:polysaccharide biosynthesis/export family protein [Armatimonadota bacterium]